MRQPWAKTEFSILSQDSIICLAIMFSKALIGITVFCLLVGLGWLGQPAQADTTCRAGFILVDDDRCVAENEFHLGDYDWQEECGGPTGTGPLGVSSTEGLVCLNKPNVKAVDPEAECDDGYYEDTNTASGDASVKYCFLYICESEDQRYPFYCPVAADRDNTALVQLNNDDDPWRGYLTGNATKVGSSCSASGCTIFDRMQQALNILAILVVPIVTVVIIIGGVQYSSAGGNPEGTKAAKGRIINGVLALVAFLLMWSVLQWLIPGGQLVG